MKASDYVAAFLHSRRIACAYEISGGMITHLLDSIHQLGKTRLISVHHEQSAAFAAEAAARMTGIPGVALATSGPGAINLLTGIGSCYFDSTPAVFITGQVNRHEQKGDRPLRQLGFQETDIVAMATPITKAAWRIQTAQELPARLDAAFALAVAGRPGPVLLDIPMDIQRLELDEPAPVSQVESAHPLDFASNPEMLDFLKVLSAALSRSHSPLILAGGGIRSAQSAAAFLRLAEQWKVPVVHSLMGVDVLPHGDPLRVGLIGSYGNRWANHALGTCDLLLVLGSRLDIRQTGPNTDAFKKGRAIFHVDCDSGELNNRLAGCRILSEELPIFLHQAMAMASPDPAGWATWIRTIDQNRREWPDTAELTAAAGINPNLFVQQLSRASTAAAAAVTDVGQHQMWAAQSYEIAHDQRFLTSGGMGSMGFGLPAAIGAALAKPGKPVVLIAGDGGFQANLQELETVRRLQLPIKIVILNNQCHGMVRQFQESYFNGRYPSTLWGYSAPDFSRVAQAYDLSALTITQPAETETALRWLWQDPSRPALLQVMIDSRTNAYPKMAFGKPVTEMEPRAHPLDMEGT